MRNTSFDSENRSEQSEIFQQNVEVITRASAAAAAAAAADNLGRLFGDLTNCTIGDITVNVNPTITFESSKVEQEFDELIGSVSLDY